MSRLFRLLGLLLVGGYLLAPALVLAAGPAPTCSMSVTPNTIPPGGSVTLRWQSTDATAASITTLGNVEVNGQRNLLPSNAETTTYFGSFTGPGGTTNCSAVVTVLVNSTVGGSSSSGASTGASGSTDTSSGSGIFGSSPSTGSTLPSSGSNSTSGGLVTCGTGNSIGTAFGDATGCQACNLAQLVQNIINFIIGISIPLVAVLFAWAGFLYYSSGARPSNIEDAHKIFANAFLGFLLVLGSWLIINTILHAVFKPVVGGNWFTIQCTTSGRQVKGDISGILGGLPQLNLTPTAGSSGASYYTCAQGTVQGNSCVDSSGNVVGTPTLSQATAGYTCGAGLTQGGGKCFDSDGNYAGEAKPPTGASGTDSDNRKLLLNNGISVISTGNCADKTSSSCTSLDGVNTGLLGNLIQMKNDGLNFAVSGGTEVGHQSTAQQTGQSVDLSACNSQNGYNDAAGVASCIQQFTTGANAVGRRLDYECQTDAQVQAVKNVLGTSAGNTRVIKVGYATGSGAFPCHFSIY